MYNKKIQFLIDLLEIDCFSHFTSAFPNPACPPFAAWQCDKISARANQVFGNSFCRPCCKLCICTAPRERVGVWCCSLQHLHHYAIQTAHKRPHPNHGETLQYSSHWRWRWTTRCCCLPPITTSSHVCSSWSPVAVLFLEPFSFFFWDSGWAEKE